MPDLPRAQKMLPFRSTPNAYEAEDQLVIGLDFGTTVSHEGFQHESRHVLR